jgi:hypothetical protein
MNRVWQTIRSYIWWTQERGSFHYDVMVTIILLFIFLAPRWISFNDKPTERNPYQAGVIVLPDRDGFIFQIDASAVRGTTDPAIGEDLVRAIEPIAGEVELLRYQPVRNAKGQVTMYRAWIRKPYR